jgi:hypothetical protein
MQNITISYMSLISLGYIECNVPDDIMKLVRCEVDEMVLSRFKDSVPYNNKLAGAIEHEYKLNKNVAIFNKFFEKVIPEYWKLNNNITESKTRYIVHLNKNNQPDMWVNFQQRGEYNPLHSHKGRLSFVIWVKIPYDLENEKKLPHLIRSNNCTGPVFSFVHSGFSEQVSIYDIPIDKSYEGKMIIFPSWLQHMVTPFYTSNDFRISVSGNLVPVL